MEKWDTCPMEEPSSRLQSWVHCCTHTSSSPSCGTHRCPLHCRRFRRFRNAGQTRWIASATSHSTSKSQLLCNQLLPSTPKNHKLDIGAAGMLVQHSSGDPTVLDSQHAVHKTMLAPQTVTSALVDRSLNGDHSDHGCDVTRFSGSLRCASNLVAHLQANDGCPTGGNIGEARHGCLFELALACQHEHIVLLPKFRHRQDS